MAMVILSVLVERFSVSCMHVFLCVMNIFIYIYKTDIFEKTLDTNGEKTNDIDLETAIRENSWFKYDKCKYKAKSERNLRKHEETHHVFSCEENISGLRC